MIDKLTNIILTLLCNKEYLKKVIILYYQSILTNVRLRVKKCNNVCTQGKIMYKIYIHFIIFLSYSRTSEETVNFLI